VPWYDFLFGTRWEPQIPLRADQIAAEGAFGWLPVLLGTLVISFVALFIATPVGLMSAIYLNEFASPGFRKVAKPVLEVLAGIPTVVYGFFAVLTIAPALRGFGEWSGLPIAPNTAMAAGIVMGVMLIPFISSFADDALSAVPRSLRDGSLALGATRAETVTKVLFPAAIPGIVGGILLAVSRAIGETMIVVMAAGLIAKMTINPLDSVTTVTVQIVTLLIGDTSFDNPKTLAAFALGMMLFVVTLGINVLALRIVRKYREIYD
jgi:phosphate transport system permease protein